MPDPNDVRVGTRNPIAARVAKSRAVNNIIHSVLDNNLTKEQQVLALRDAIKHPDMELHSASAGLVVDNALLQHVADNLKTVIKLATTTAHKFGRSPDDLRSIVQTIVLATLPSPTSTQKFSGRKIADLLGLAQTTHRRHVKAVEAKRAALEGIFLPTAPFLIS